MVVIGDAPEREQRAVFCEQFDATWVTALTLLLRGKVDEPDFEF